MTNLTESNVEEVVLVWLGEVGWDVALGPGW